MFGKGLRSLIVYCRTQFRLFCDKSIDRSLEKVKKNNVGESESVALSILSPSAMDLGTMLPRQLDLTKVEAFADNKLNGTQMLMFGWEENTVEKRKNSLSAICTFSTLFLGLVN